MPAYAPELRPYRVATYIVFLAFTLTFITQVIRSVGRDLYGTPSKEAPSGQAMTFASCKEQLEGLNRRLEARLNSPIAPRAEKDWTVFKRDWDTFTRGFEDNLRHFQAECVDQKPAGATEAAVPAFAAAAERLDSLRQHLARCGEEGEAERESVSAAIKRLRTLADAPGH